MRHPRHDAYAGEFKACDASPDTHCIALWRLPCDFDHLRDNSDFFLLRLRPRIRNFWRPGGRLDDPLAGSLPRAEFCAAGFVGVNPPHHWKAKKSLSDMDACAMCLTLRHTANPFSLSVASLDEDLASQCLCFRFKTFYNELNHLLREYRRVAAVALCGLKPRHILAWKGDRLG